MKWLFKIQHLNCCSYVSINRKIIERFSHGNSDSNEVCLSQLLVYCELERCFDERRSSLLQRSLCKWTYGRCWLWSHRLYLPCLSISSISLPALVRLVRLKNLVSRRNWVFRLQSVNRLGLTVSRSGRSD